MKKLKLAALLPLFLIFASQVMAEFAFIPINNDADSQISTDNEYTHAIDFGNQPGNNPLANVNGVQFANGNPGAFPGAVGSGTVGTGSSTIPNGHPGNGGHNTFGAVSGLFGDMTYNDATADIQLTGLTPGVTYDFRYYMRQWGAGTRTQDFLFDGDGDGIFESTIRISQDNATLDPPGFASANQAYAFSFTYTAGASGTLNLKVNTIGGGTFHLYGLTNQVVDVADADGDGLPDAFEAEHTDPESATALNAADDLDNDGLTNLQEFENRTDPNNADSDGDGLKDGDEIAGAGSRPATSPTSADTDGDGLSDLVENNTGVFVSASDTGTDPVRVDTDGDGASDGVEVASESDPNDDGDLPTLPFGSFALTGPLTDDDSSGIDPANDYTHAVSGGGVETVNGVTFELLNSTTLPSNFNWTVSSIKNQIDNNNGGWDLGSAGVTGPGLRGLLGSFTFNNDGAPGSNQTFTLSALTPGQTYETRLYIRKWSDDTARGQTATFTAGAQAPASITFFADHPEELPTALPNRDSAWYLSHRYTADASGSLTIRFEVQPSGSVQGNPGSFHLYGLTNQMIDTDDADGDGLTDSFELEHTDPQSATALNADDDLDNDGLTNLQEFENKTDPNEADSDGDGLNDGDEIAGAGSRPATNPTRADSDGDGLSDFAETNTGAFAGASDTGTDPTNPDTDGDGAPDGEEVAAGSNPHDSNDRPPLSDGFALTGPLTDDASSGIDPANDYTHAISGGGVETVNGVTFDLLDRTARPPNFEWSASSQQNMINDNNGGWNVAASGLSGPGLLGLFGSFTYNSDGNAGSNQTFTLSALIPGQTYETRLYMRKWDNSTARGQTATFTAGGQAPSSITFFEDHPEELPTGLPNRDSAWYLSYTYTADAAGTLAIRFEVQPSGVVQGNPGSFHLYGLTNQVASAPAPLEITDISYNAATSSLSIVFNSQPGANYALDYSTTLEEGDWQELDDGIIAEGIETTVVDTFLIPNLPRRAWLRVRKVE